MDVLAFYEYHVRDMARMDYLFQIATRFLKFVILDHLKVTLLNLLFVLILEDLDNAVILRLIPLMEPNLDPLVEKYHVIFP